MRQIPLTRGLFALVDDEDFDRVSRFKWCASGPFNGNKFYAARRRSKDNRHIKMHRFIVDALDGECVDHRNGNGLDNCRSNLRRCTKAQNVWNRSPDRRSKTGFKGVHFFVPAGKWYAHIRVRDHLIHLGTFNTADDAARAYDVAARKHFGEFAKPNFQ